MRIPVPVVALIGVILIFVVFYFDTSMPRGVAGGAPYVLVVTLGLIYRSKSLIVLFGLSGVVLTITGYFMSPPGGDVVIVLFNRLLVVMIIGVLSIFGYRFLTRQFELENRIREQADIDTLTQVATRGNLMRQFEHRTIEAKRYHHALSVIMIDVDFFKKVNDSHGHLAGDEVLKQVAGLCAALIRDTDIIGRYGGEEFLVVCPNTDIQAATKLAERLRQAVAELAIGLDDREIRVTLSAGVARLREGEDAVNGLLGRADQLLYKAKEQGRNRVISEVVRVVEADAGIRKDRVSGG